MKKNVEIEVKALVDKTSYTKLIKYFNKAKYKQINYYIDTKDFALSKERLSLRIRKKKGYELTFKSHLKVGLLEINEKITEKKFIDFKKKHIFPKGEIATKLTKLGFMLNDLVIITSLTTTRMDIKYQGGLLSIDMNQYNKNIDYEVEFEYRNKMGATNTIKHLFKELKIPFKVNQKSKVSRAFSSL